MRVCKHFSKVREAQENNSLDAVSPGMIGSFLKPRNNSVVSIKSAVTPLDFEASLMQPAFDEQTYQIDLQERTVAVSV